MADDVRTLVFALLRYGRATTRAEARREAELEAQAGVDCPFAPEWSDDEADEKAACDSKVKDIVTHGCIPNERMVRLPNPHDPTRFDCFDSETLRQTFVAKGGFRYPHHNKELTAEAVQAYRDQTGDDEEYAAAQDDYEWVPVEEDDEEVPVADDLLLDQVQSSAEHLFDVAKESVDSVLMATLTIGDVDGDVLLVCEFTEDGVEFVDNTREISGDEAAQLLATMSLADRFSLVVRLRFGVDTLGENIAWDSNELQIHNDVKYELIGGITSRAYCPDLAAARDVIRYWHDGVRLMECAQMVNAAHYYPFLHEVTAESLSDVNVNIVDAEGCTPLYKLVELGSIATSLNAIDILLAQPGIAVDVVPHDRPTYETVLFHMSRVAFNHGPVWRTCVTLIRKGADVQNIIDYIDTDAWADYGDLDAWRTRLEQMFEEVVE